MGQQQARRQRPSFERAFDASGEGAGVEAMVAGLNNRALKRFLKDRNIAVKHYKERGLLVEDVLEVLRAEAWEAQLRQGVMVVLAVVCAFVVFRLIQRYRRVLRNAFHLNPWWLIYWAMQRALVAMSYLNMISVVCSWILPPQWNLARVYFWDLILPDFGSVPIPLPSSAGRSGGPHAVGTPGQQQQSAPSMGINLMPVIVGWAIRKGQAEVENRMSVTPMFRDGFRPVFDDPSTTREDSDDDDTPSYKKEEAGDEDDIVFLSEERQPGAWSRMRHRGADPELRRRRRSGGATPPRGVAGNGWSPTNRVRHSVAETGNGDNSDDEDDDASEQSGGSMEMVD